MFDVAKLNSMSEMDAHTVLAHCCGATRWVERMAAQRPFANAEEVFAAARTIVDSLSDTDWLEAFAAHPRIGDLESLRTRFAGTAAWSAQEQGAVASAAETTIQALAAGNRAYEAKFAHIFIVCATGKSAAEMLALLEQRLGNDPAAELRIAAAEQRKITELRLRKLLNENAP